MCQGIGRMLKLINTPVSLDRSRDMSLMQCNLQMRILINIITLYILFIPTLNIYVDCEFEAIDRKLLALMPPIN
jgi:hypothetical protein